MSRGKRGFVAVFVALLQLAIMAGPAFAGVQGTECTSDSSRVRLWENVQ
jgi:hypothetical protein